MQHQHLCTPPGCRVCGQVLQIDNEMVAQGHPNFEGAKITLPSNLVFWETIIHTDEDARTVKFLRYGFPAGYEGPVPTPSSGNHVSAINHCIDVAVYVNKELSEESMLRPFDKPPFMLWCQTNPLLTWPKKDSVNCRVIMDLCWALPPSRSINGSTPRDTFFGQSRKIHLPSAHNLSCLIHHAGKGAYLYSKDVAHAYRQLPLNPADWPLVCFQFEGRFFNDVSLPFGLRWATSHCQDFTSLITRELGRQDWLSSTISMTSEG